MSAEVLGADMLDGERDAAGAVADAVAVGAVLVRLVFDEVTQKVVVRTPPLSRQLRDVCVVLIVVRTRQSDLLTRLTDDFHHTACRQKSVKSFTVTHHQ